MCGGGPHKAFQTLQGVFGYLGMLLAWAAAGTPWVLVSASGGPVGSATLSFWLVQVCVTGSVVGVTSVAACDDYPDTVTAANRLRAACGLLAFSGILILVISILSSTRCCLCCGAGRSGSNKGNVIAAVVLSALAWVCSIAGTALVPSTPLGNLFALLGVTSGLFLNLGTVSDIVSKVPGAVWGPGYGLGITTCIFASVILLFAVLELVIPDNTPKQLNAAPVSSTTVIVSSPAAGPMVTMGAPVMMMGQSQPAMMPPMQLPPGWAKAGPTAEGRFWYVHADGRTQWEVPAA